MLNKGIRSMVFITAVLVGVCFYLFTASGQVEVVTVSITDNGFVPEKVQIENGTKISFVNNGKDSHWPASNIHPTHRLYPGSDIELCGAGKEKELFDSCRGLKTGEIFSFVFKNKGEWKYHDHLYPNLKGAIIVNEEPKDKRGFAFYLKNIFSSLGNLFLSIFDLFDFGSEVNYQYNKDIAVDSEDIFKDKNALFSYIMKFGTSLTIGHLYELEGKLGDCHNNAHEVGRMSYELKGGLAFKECRAECHSGCYHGVTEAYFREKGTENLVNDINFLCDGSLNQFFMHQCIHGVGHGIMVYTDYDLPEALKKCDDLPKDILSCYSGIFMENIVGTFDGADGHFTKYLSDDPHYPCNIVEDKYKGQCYFLQTSRMVKLFKSDFSKVAIECTKIGKENLNRLCFQSLGRDIGGHNRNNVIEAIKDCQFSPEGIYRNDCLSGAVQNFFWDPSGQDNALKFCKSLRSEDEKSTCYDTIFDRGSQILDKNSFTIFCEKSEVSFKDKCLLELDKNIKT